MYCNHCGKVIQDDALLCAYCGKRVGGIPAQHRLVRPQEGRKVGGVAMGMAEYWGVDISMVRLAWVLGALLLPPFGLVAYIIAWVVIPDEPLRLPAPAAAPNGANSVNAS